MRGKRKRGEQRLTDLVVLARREGFRVEVFSRVHCRVHGSVAVDYWPTTATAWVLGCGSKATRGFEPAEVVALAKQERVVDEAAAVSHMRSIAEEGPPPW